MIKPVNKSLNYQINKMKRRRKNSKIYSFKNNISNNKSIDGVTIITCTNRHYFMKNIFDNYIRQNFENKELILILNDDSLPLDKIIELANTYPNVKVFQLSQSLSLGQCLNYAVVNSSYDVIAKFDDDDYYGPNYISEAITPFYYLNIGLVGKGTTIVYFKGTDTLALRDLGSENCYVKFVNGSTMVFTKKIFDKVKFRNINIGEDVAFCNDCRKNKIKIYSTSRYNHVYIRYPSKKQHTWKIDDQNFIKRYCHVLGHNIDFIKYSNNL